MKRGNDGSLQFSDNYSKELWQILSQKIHHHRKLEQIHEKYLQLAHCKITAIVKVDNIKF